MGTGKKVYSMALGLVLAMSFSSAAMARRQFIAPVQPLALGDVDADYVFTPVPPCRIVNTKAISEIISGGTSREFLVYGAAGELYAQGGDAGGCLSPVGEPRAVHINVTVVPAGVSGGNVRVYPAGETTPGASLVNFKPGVNIANAATIKTTSGTAAETDLEVYASTDAYVIMDVMGYYSLPEATALDITGDEAADECPDASTCELVSPECPAGYSMTGGSCDFGDYSYDTGDLLPANPHDFSVVWDYPGGPSWSCVYRNDTGEPVLIYASIVCARTPGR